jgi:hypothetical protein
VREFLQMIRFHRKVVLPLAVCTLLGCRPYIDPSLRPYVGSQKDVKLFLSKPVEKQIEIYLKVAELPGHPADYSWGAVIATSNGDIGRTLESHLTNERDRDRVSDLILLSGKYCALNEKCRGEDFLDVAARAAAQPLPANYRDLVKLSLDWIAQGVARN